MEADSDILFIKLGIFHILHPLIDRFLLHFDDILIYILYPHFSISKKKKKIPTVIDKIISTEIMVINKLIIIINNK